VQTTLLGLAIAFIIALVAALIGPYFVDWNQFRPQFEAEATQVIGAPVRVAGELDARLLPSPSLRLRSVVVGRANDLGKVRADKLDVEFSLGSLMRGEWRATELTINGMALDLGLDPQGRIDWPASTGKFSLGTLSIDRLNLTGRAALHDALSRSTLELNDIVFSGDVRALAGSVRGDGSFLLKDVRYPFRVSSGQSADGNGTRIHFNLDPGMRPLSAELDGVLNFDARAPRFEGSVALAASPRPKPKGSTDPVQPPWRIAARVKADHAAARLEQIEVNYGAEDRALKLAGQGDVRFGASPLLRAALSARQLDADRFAAKENVKDGTAKDVSAEPVRVLPAWRALIAAAPELPLPAQIELGAEQIMMGGRPLQNFAAEVRTDTRSWTIDRLDVRAPGSTHLSLSGTNAQAGPSGHFKGALNLDSADPDALVMWLQGRSELTYRSQKPLRLGGNVDIGVDRLAIDAIRCEIDGGTVEGRIAVSHDDQGAGSLEAELRADRLDLDSASAFARAILGPQGEWPEQAQVSLDISHAVLAGRELNPLLAKFGYGPKSVALDRLKIGMVSGVTVEAFGAFDRTNATGKLALNSSAASLGQFAGLIAPVAPSVAARLNSMALSPGPARINLMLAVDKDADRADHADTHATLDLDAPQFRGTATITARPEAAALREIDLEKLRRSEISLESKLSSEQGAPLLALLGLDGTLAAGDGAGQFQGSLSGVWGAPLRLKLNLSAAGLDAEAQGTADPFAAQPNGSVSVKARSLNLAPLFELKRSDKLAQNISLSSRMSLQGGKLSLEDLDGTMAGSRLRGHLAVTFEAERKVEGELGLDSLELAPAFALAIGAAGRDPAEPLGAGLLRGWRGRIAFQALRGVLPGGTELRPLSGTVKGDGQTLVFDTIKGGIGGGEASGTFDIRQGAGGLALNSRVQLDAADGTALRYHAFTLPAGRASLQMTLSSQGRSASALIGALSGSGTLTLGSARIPGLDPRAFELAIHASDAGQATDDARLRKIVEPALSGGALLVASAQIPFAIRDGRLRVAATPLNSDIAHAVVSGGYDIPADQADIRAVLSSGTAELATSRPEIVVFAAGSPDALNRSVDVTALSSWLAVRAIDRETRRLDSIDRGEAPTSAAPASIPRNPIQPPAVSPRPRIPPPRPPATPQGANAPAGNVPVAPSSANPPDAPVVSQQVPPLPPPVEVRPAPGVARPARPKPPLVLTPPLFGSPPQAY
jgi:large subunit ribosomal protein L24